MSFVVIVRSLFPIHSSQNQGLHKQWRIAVDDKCKPRLQKDDLTARVISKRNPNIRSSITSDKAAQGSIMHSTVYNHFGRCYRR